MGSRFAAIRALSLAVVACLGVTAPTMAQAPQAAGTGVTLSGRLYHSVTLKPVADAVVLVEGTKLEGKSKADGSYSIAGVPPGDHHLIVVAPGFVAARVDVTVGHSPATLDVAVDPELHYAEVVSVSPDARSQFDAYQPTTVLSGQDLAKQLQNGLGATLANQPGVAERSFGPGPSRPVIRGLDGDRVLILEDGQRVGDLSSQSGDHGVTVNPASASTIEVVRGPATLLYGSNAIGGLVNVISDTIPTKPVTGTHGGATFDFGSAATDAGAAADLVVGDGKWALHASGSGRRSGDVSTPEGEVENTQSRAGFGTVGVAYTGEHRFFGGSYGYDDTKYGIPFVEDGNIQLTPRRHMFGAPRRRRPAHRTVRVLSRAVRLPPLPPRRARGRRSRHPVRERHRRHQRPGEASAGGPVVGYDRRVVSQPRLQRDRRGGVVTAGRRDRDGALRLRGADLAAFHGAVRRPRELGFLQSRGRTAEPRLHRRFGVGRPAVPSGRGQRQADAGAEPRPRRAQPGARRDVLLRRPPRQLRLRDRQPGSRFRDRARLRRGAALARASGSRAR